MSDTDKISIIKIRNNGGNAVATIPRSVMRTADWQLGDQIIFKYDPVNKIIIVKKVDVKQFNGGEWNEV